MIRIAGRIHCLPLGAEKEVLSGDGVMFVCMGTHVHILYNSVMSKHV